MRWGLSHCNSCIFVFVIVSYDHYLWPNKSGEEMVLGFSFVQGRRHKGEHYFQRSLGNSRTLVFCYAIMSLTGESSNYLWLKTGHPEYLVFLIMYASQLVDLVSKII